MKFVGLEIKKELFGKNEGKFIGRIYFDLKTGGEISLNIDDEFSRKIIEICIPLLTQAVNEEIEIIKEEIQERE
jgi:hypothetical protein